MTGRIYRNGQLVETGLASFRGYSVRPGTMDEYVIRELKSYTDLNVAEKVVLDIGANIGSFSRWASEQNAKTVVSVEPDETNMELLQINAPNSVHVRAAVVAGDESSISLYRTENGVNSGNYSTTAFRGRSAVSVPAVKFMDLLAKWKPEVLKIDCEGAEYGFLTEQLPSHVKQVAIELHLTRPTWREEATKLVQLFAEWNAIRTPKIGEKNWHTLGVWYR